MLRNCLGYFDTLAASIVISKRVKGPMAWWTLRHELGHAFLHITGAMFLLHNLIDEKNPQVWDMIEEVIVRDGMVPHATSVARDAMLGG